MTALHLDESGAGVQGDRDLGLGALGLEGQLEDPGGLDPGVVRLVANLGQEERCADIRTAKSVAVSRSAEQGLDNYHPETWVAGNSDVLTLLVHLDCDIRLVQITEDPGGVLLLVEGVGVDEGVDPGLDARAGGGRGEGGPAARYLQGCGPANYLIRARGATGRAEPAGPD